MTFLPIPQWYINKYQRKWDKDLFPIEELIVEYFEDDKLDEKYVNQIIEYTLKHQKFFIPVFVKKNSTETIKCTLFGTSSLSIKSKTLSWKQYYYNLLDEHDFILYSNVQEPYNIMGDIIAYSDMKYHNFKVKTSDKMGEIQPIINNKIQQIDDDYQEKLYNSWVEYNVDRYKKYYKIITNK